MDNKDKIYNAIIKSSEIGRTSRGLSEELSIPQLEVIDILNNSKFKGEYLMTYKRTNQYGEKVYTTKELFKKNASMTDKILDVICF